MIQRQAAILQHQIHVRPVAQAEGGDQAIVPEMALDDAALGLEDDLGVAARAATVGRGCLAKADVVDVNRPRGRVGPRKGVGAVFKVTRRVIHDAGLAADVIRVKAAGDIQRRGLASGDRALVGARPARGNP